MSRKNRIADFAMRSERNPEWLVDLGPTGRYIAVNPMSDEVELLATLELDPAACIKVDLYWEYQGDVRFVQIHTEKYNPNSSVGIYARRKSRKDHINLVSVVNDAAISSTRVEAILRDMARLDLERMPLTSAMQRCNQAP